MLFINYSTFFIFHIDFTFFQFINQTQFYFDCIYHSNGWLKGDILHITTTIQCKILHLLLIIYPTQIHLVHCYIAIDIPSINQSIANAIPHLIKYYKSFNNKILCATLTRDSYFAISTNIGSA